MSSRKENFNQALFDMFGVGKVPESAAEEETEAPVAAEAPINKAVWQQALGGPDMVPPQPEAPAMVSVPAQAPVAPPASSFTIGPSVAPFSVVAATYIAPGTVIDGNIRSKGDVEIAGTLNGDIDAGGDVTVRTGLQGNVTATNLNVVECRMKGNSVVSGKMYIDENSVVEGDIKVGDLICAGILHGDCDVENSITLTSTAQVSGQIYTDTMSMERGARITGSMTMGKCRDEEPKKEKKTAKKTEKSAEAEE